MNVLDELFPEQEGLIEEVEEDHDLEDVKAAQAKRYGELFGQKEFMDPFWVEHDKEWKKNKETPVDQTETEEDPDLLM